jgi:tetrahydromethanopterin S-methyltransferase subunit A
LALAKAPVPSGTSLSHQTLSLNIESAVVNEVAHSNVRFLLLKSMVMPS